MTCLRQPEFMVCRHLYCRHTVVRDTPISLIPFCLSLSPLYNFQSGAAILHTNWPSPSADKEEMEHKRILELALEALEKQRPKLRLKLRLSMLKCAAVVELYRQERQHPPQVCQAGEGLERLQNAKPNPSA